MQGDQKFRARVSYIARSTVFILAWEGVSMTSSPMQCAVSLLFALI